jgi:hypothetical protein
VGFCSLREGLALFFLGPFAGALVAGGWGALAGSLAGRLRTPWRRDAFALLLALLGPASSALLSGFRFYTSPLVFAFDPFVGFFSGTLYDTVIDGTDRLTSYRLGTLASWAAAVGLALHLPARHWLGWRSAVTLGALASSAWITWNGPALGHYQTSSSLRQTLGGSLRGPFCEVVYPLTLKREEATLFLRDCEQQLASVSSFLELERRPVTAYLFADAGQKRRLMGAAETYIAKPWRREVYLQASGYPHPVLGHELAHVVAGQAGRGPFRVAGMFGGWLPDPGLVEGLAVAASPEDDELSPEQWSRAMLELKLLPRLSSLFSIGFYGHSSGRAYTVAGAFVGWIRQRHGAAALLRWYGGAPLPAVAGRGWAALEEEFHAHLRSLPLPEGSLAVARARFDRPSLFQRRCPHEVDARKRDAAQALGSGNLEGALRALDEVNLLAPRDPGATLLRATCAERLGDEQKSRELLRGLLQDEAMARSFRDRAEERLGDQALQRSDLGEAARHYEALLARVLEEDALRTLDLKLLATRDPLARPAIKALLLGPPGRTPDLAIATEELARWSERAPESGIPLYLLGRNALLRGFPERAAVQLDLALARSIPLPRVSREAARQRVIASCILRDPDGLLRGLAAWQAAQPPAGSRDALLRSLAARCIEGPDGVR